MQTLLVSTCPQAGAKAYDFVAIDAQNAAILEAAINAAECLLEDEKHQQHLAQQAELDQQYWQNEAAHIAHNEAIDAVYFAQYK